MAAPEISTKRLAISKANAQMVAIVGVASFITIFCLVASQAVWSQLLYQGRLTSAKTAANNMLQKNSKAYDQLSAAYDTFNSASTNAIGGNSNGTGEKDGTNSNIVLDALPSSYDFPALTASLEKVLKDQNLTISNISGTDDQLAQQDNLLSPTPQAVPIPFSFTITSANYTSVQQLISTLQSSIRPIAIDSMTISGSANNMQLTVNAHTYYQPSKSLNITKKVVK